VRAAAGPADDRESPQPVFISDGLHVSGDIKGDQTDSQPVQDSRPRMRAEPTAGCPVQQEHRVTVGVAVHLSSGLSFAGSSNHKPHGHPSSTP
jgi:hypothetical protein